MANKLKHSRSIRTKRKRISWKQTMRKWDTRPIGKIVKTPLHDPRRSDNKRVYFG